jgi:hypothetical protein
MSKKTISSGKMWLLGGAAVLATALAPMAAQAAPYAFAANNITGLTLTGNFTPLGTATTSATATAFYGGVGAPGATADGVVGNALSIPQVSIGGNAGTIADNTFTPNGPAGFSGSRADANIGAGSVASGGVTVQNVAETGGNQNGQATGQNTSTINFTVTGAGSAITLSLTDTIRLIASTDALVGESANATVTNTFEVRNAANQVVFTENPDAINRQISSAGGIPGLADVNPGSQFVQLITPVLQSGQNYTISLRSIASVTTTVGTPVPVPEPMSLALFGMGLAGLGLVRRRKA